ncbi:ATP-binding protein [Variovorax paradoxus]|uniref:tetratricopeptide repeat protein n=1 Tax=Variovorax paradoxus TaxID=34073 RepID=UPI0003A94716|nr:hypothetical protein [Variovorax paradoxus]
MSSRNVATTNEPAKETVAPPPAEGERRAVRGYVAQYGKAGAAIYSELERGEMQWVGLADRKAGIADDLVLGFDGLVVGHQFKTSKFPAPFTVTTLLTGADGLLKPLIHAWQILSKDNPDARVEIRFVTTDYPSTTDKPGDSMPAYSAEFIDQFGRFPNRTLAEWRAGGWRNLIDRLLAASGLNEIEFERFLHALRILHGAAADFVQLHKLSAEQSRLASEIASLLPNLVADGRDKDRWTRDELLAELGWPDPAKTRYVHRFPLGTYVQRNRDTETELLKTVRGIETGYVALIGPPGSGKSTLLQMALAAEPALRLVRYLAFVPGVAQGVGRGEAETFLDDISAQLRNSGLHGIRLRDNSLHERREQFGALICQAGERYAKEKIRTLIVVDGLDHIPREERPAQSLLSELPLPEALPAGVMFVLGTQRLDLAHLKPAVQDQAAKPGRQVTMKPLDQDAVARMADALGLDPHIPRVRLHELSHGHPLASRYLIQALLRADGARRAHVLAGGMEFDGDIESVYEAAWREIANDRDATDVLGYIARAEAPIALPLLATILDERAIERALAVARHLLLDSTQGWRVFHNSFRLFVIAKPRVRLGSVETDYSQRVYRELAKLAQNAPDSSPQRWLELRYRARAGDADDVLALATPARFREQLARGRSGTDIQDDIRLSLLAARPTLDGTMLTRLLLCRDEVSRRTNALEYADRLPSAMLAVGDIDAAVSFVQEFPKRGYEVVDALLQRGDFDRSKELFEHLEPLSQLHTSRFQHHGRDHNLHEFQEWAKRAYNFRDSEQIQQAIERLVADGLEKVPGHPPDESEAPPDVHLRLEVARAVLEVHPGTAAEDVCNQLGIDRKELPALLVHAGLAIRNAGDTERAMQLFDEAAQQPDFEALPNGWRRAIALTAAKAGRTDLAATLFDKLAAPMISMGDDEVSYAGPGALATAVMEHAQLCTMLGKEMPPAIDSKHEMLRPLQKHAAKTGILLGRVAANLPISAGGVQAVTRNALGYALRLTPRGGSDFYRTSQVLTAVPLLARALLRVAASCGENEYRAVLREVDEAIASSTLKSTEDLRREVAVETYRLDGDRARAAARLEALAAELHRDTPSEHVDALAELAVAFAAVGETDRARQLLATVPDHCLGYALAARKDPQYTVWRDVLVLANKADPAGRAARTSHLMRQIDGMKETEGANAAHRLTMVLIDEAMQVDARFGYDTAQALAAWNLVSWPNRVDLLMTGLVRRRPDLLWTCVEAWCGLCLPFYMEPHYRDPYHVGDFIDVAGDAAGPGAIAQLVGELLGPIEITSRAHERAALLERLRTAALKHGYGDGRLDAALVRWKAEAPAPRRSYTPSTYDSAETLAQLQAMFEAGPAPDYNAPSRFVDLAEAAPLDRVRAMYEQWEILRADTKCRFMLVTRLIDAGELEQARKLVDEYPSTDDRWSAWSQFMGGGKFRYHRARKLLDGAAAHRAAFESLIDSITAGEENTVSLLMEIDEVLPVVSESPDWPAVWSLLAEQMMFTREYQLGKPFKAGEEPLSDEELLFELVHFGQRLPIIEAQRHARDCLLRLSEDVAVGEAVATLTVRRLLTGESDAPLQGLFALLAMSHNRLASALGDAVAHLAGHRDIAIAESALLLASRWGITVSAMREALPLFYQLELDGSLVLDSSLVDARTGAMRIESAPGWTQLLRPIARALAQTAGVDELTIRRRAAEFIQQWGGLEAFGALALRCLEAELRSLDMQITYLKPHMAVGVVALRHVAGEVRRAGLLSDHDLPLFLEILNAPLPSHPLLRAQVRPQAIPRPLVARDASWGEAGRAWTARVNEDVAPWSLQPEDVVIAEACRFTVFKPRQAEFLQHRFRAPEAPIDSDDFDDGYEKLPAVVWRGAYVTHDATPATTLVRRVASSSGTDLYGPRYLLTICPNWLHQLRWRQHDSNPRVYMDSGGTAVAKLVWWRDAGPVDIDDESIWGEGCYLALAPHGLSQYEAAGGQPTINSFASREVVAHSGHGETSSRKTARHSYTI